MAKIKYYRVEISDNTGIIKNRNEFNVSEFNVIGENEYHLCIDNINFTTLEKQSRSKYKLYDVIDKPSISINVADTCFGNGITYSLYTYTEKKASQIRKEIQAAIDKKIGFFANGIDLSIVK